MLTKEVIIYEERKRTYHMVHAIAEVSRTETHISKKLKELIKETEKEAEELYLLSSDKIHTEGGDMYE